MIATAAMLLAACSTQKAKWGNIQFHNTTAHYNTWWNGNESLKQGVEKLNRKVKDDYTRLLPVYKIGTKEECLAFNPEFDRAIEKGVKAIKKHSIFVGGHEYVPYVANSYMLTAYASFYKHDYVTCVNTCQMLSSQYHGEEIGDEADILLARCSTQEQRYREAESALDEKVVADGKGDLNKSQRLNLYLAMAECTLPQEKFKKGVLFLKQALDQRPTVQQQARINFILGQIYQQQDKRPTATKYYERVLRCSPDYEMEFNARLNIASCANLQNTDYKKLERQLDRMLDDKKNVEFRDQIYYAKGEMYVGLREMKKACENLRISSAASTNNPAQKARACLRLGGILYDQYHDYDNAQRYYDTAMAIVKSDYPHYDFYKSRHTLLTSLVAFTRVYENNDSLIAVANMPEKERTKLIGKKIEELKKREEEAKEREMLEALANESKAQTNTLQGDWYFYNSKTVQLGKEQFRQRWGNRVLEDYWFLSNKGMLGMNMMANMMLNDTIDSSEADDSTATDSTAAKDPKNNPDDPHNVAYYLKSLPATEEAIDSMQRQTAVCLLNAGYIFYDGIGNLGKGLECYLRLASDYTQYEGIDQAFYMLYKIYDKQGNTPNANYYRNMVLMGFPDSDFANLILDEDYFREIIRRGQLVKEDYAQIYTLFRKHRYDEVVKRAEAAKEMYAEDSLLGKFCFWEGLAYARLDRKNQAIGAFQHIVENYASDDTLVALAQSQLDYLMGDGGQYVVNSGEEVLQDGSLTADATKARVANANKKQVAADSEEELPPEAQLFRYKESIPHFVVVLISDNGQRATVLQSKIGNFNRNFYSNAGLKVSPMMFTDTTQMVTIASFKDAAEGYAYAMHLMRPESPLNEIGLEKFRVFTISKQNYTTFYNRKNVDAYQLFYDRYYVK